jgi:release factor glutamine methyltransferase
MSTPAGSVREALAAAVDALAAAGVETPRLDAEVMLAEASGRERFALVAEPEGELSGATAREFGEMVRRRLRREPVAYIIGRKGFRRLELDVDRRVLIPRPETELLVDVALELGPRRLLDVGTGSGAVALAVAEELPACEVTATDTSEAALEVARANAERLGLADRVAFLPGTLPAGGQAAGDEDKPFDLIVANLPYVAERDWAWLQPEIAMWEPREALLAGPDGLDAYRALLGADAPPGKPPASAMPDLARAIAIEVGEGQAPAVAEMLRGAGYAAIETRHDLAGIERVVLARAERDRVER